MITYAKQLLNGLARDERGLTSVEYAVLGGIVVSALVLVGAAFTADLGTAFGALFDGT